MSIRVISITVHGRYANERAQELEQQLNQLQASLSRQPLRIHVEGEVDPFRTPAAPQRYELVSVVPVQEVGEQLEWLDHRWFQTIWRSV